MTDRQLYVLEIAIMTVSSIIAIGLGFWGVYLGQKALTMTAESESLQVRPVLTVERNLAGPSLKVYNLGFGPAEIVYVAMGYVDADGVPVIFDSDRAQTDGNYFDFFGLNGINADLPPELLVESFDMMGTWGVDEQINILTIPGRHGMPEAWRAEWEPTLERIFDTFAVCVIYLSLDKVETVTSTSPDICDGPHPENARYYVGP